nr:immunoglobulin heavy chain junction region [Macaca mulatta]MOW82046.1 immunoglobulin heavy chain junction region [Macaca mulatta]MOW83049.1 immunoglobulin heavy chain junction region [Macaca mulatta]MOW84193.1 immunoglobulin heavy chain junction region [Macaca mulatta]MOW84550.1 immunoglobulin heavy chain junction region [Macaca mulatta]
CASLTNNFWSGLGFFASW